jgi:hypothetical protein
VQVAAWLVLVQVKNKRERSLPVRPPGVEKTSRLRSRDPVASGSSADCMVAWIARWSRGRFLGRASKPRSSRDYVGAESCKPLNENRAAASAQLDRSDRSPPPVRPVRNMWRGPALWPVRPVTTTGQTGDTQSPKMARNHLKTFQMHSVGQNMPKLLPLVDNAWSKPKMQKMQPRDSQIDKIQHRLLHMSKWAS